MTPGAFHRVALYLSINHVVDRIAPAVGGISLKVNGGTLVIKRRFFKFDGIRAGIHGCSQVLAVPFQLNQE